MMANLPAVLSVIAQDLPSNSLPSGVNAIEILPCSHAMMSHTLLITEFLSASLSSLLPPPH